MARTFRLRPGQGDHIMKGGRRITQDSPLITCEQNLARAFPKRFEDVTGRDVVTIDHPWGIAVLSSFPLAEEIDDCIVWKKNRRYRIAIAGKLEDTPKLLTEESVNAELKKIMKRIRNEDAFDEQGNEEDDDEEDDDSGEVDTDEDALLSGGEDDEDDEEIVKPAKSKTKAATKSKSKKTKK